MQVVQCPELLFGDEVVEQLMAHAPHPADAPPPFAATTSGAFSMVRARTSTMIFFGIEQLAGGVGRADRRAPAALGAGVAVQQLLPGKVVDVRCAVLC